MSEDEPAKMHDATTRPCVHCGGAGRIWLEGPTTPGCSFMACDCPACDGLGQVAAEMEDDDDE